MRIAFLMDPLESIDPVLETTSCIMYECNQRGHSVYFLEPHDLYIRGNQIVARMRDVSAPRDLSLKKYWRTLIRGLKREDRIFETLTEMDAIFLRKNPPLVRHALEMLAPIEDRVFILNSTRGQQLAHTKLYALNFPDIIPETHLSRDPWRLLKVIEEFGGSMIIKPISRFGGEGVIKVSMQEPLNLNSIIHFYVQSSRPYEHREPIMVQEYLGAGLSEGDVRVLLLNGEVLGAMRRIPAGDDFRANIHSGGRAVRHRLTPAQAHVCEVIKGHLVRDGLYFVGIDLIGDKLIEINCLSPGGVPRINRLEGVKLEETIVDFIEGKAAETARRAGRP
jgi:glutathione synthase